MKNRVAEFFEESDGRLSSMRLFSFIALLNALMISNIGLITGVAALEIVTQLTPWLVAAFVPKAIQKFAENKIPKEEKPNE